FTPPDLDFDGQGFTGVFPPDTVGAVAPRHYIQLVNTAGGSAFVVLDKSTGAVVAGPSLLSALWTGDGRCASGFGDGIVLFDQLASRWLMSEFAIRGNHLCVYVSRTSDPLGGGWFGYDFGTAEFPDYPKYAVWPDAYYVSTNESAPAAYALERARMIAGLPAGNQRFTAPSLGGFSFQALTPADLDGSTPPPPGAPGFFLRHRRRRHRPRRPPLVRAAAKRRWPVGPVPGGHVCAGRERSLARQHRSGRRRQHRDGLQHHQPERLSRHPLHRATRRRSRGGDDRGGDDHRRRHGCAGQRAVGRLQLDERRPGRRLHLLVHQRVRAGQRSVEDAHRPLSLRQPDVRRCAGAGLRRRRARGRR